MKDIKSRKAVELSHLRPHFLSDDVITNSEVYGQEIRFECGEYYLIKAPSGKGKSTLLNILFGIQPNYAGQVTGIEEARHRFSYVLQDLKLFPELSALENILIKNRLTSHKTETAIHEMLAQVGLATHADQPASTLSFGQRQRVALVRALCMPFDFLLLDEPFSHLDIETANTVASLIQEELQAQDAGLIIAMLDDSAHFPYQKRFLL